MSNRKQLEIAFLSDANLFCFHNKAQKLFTASVCKAKSRTSPNYIDYFNQTRHFSAPTMLNNSSARKKTQFDCFLTQGRHLIHPNTFYIKTFLDYQLQMHFTSKCKLSMLQNASNEQRRKIVLCCRKKIFVCVLSQLPWDV